MSFTKGARNASARKISGFEVVRKDRKEMTARAILKVSESREKGGLEGKI